MTTEQAGELAGLATSALWVISSLTFAAAGKRIGSTRVNLLRSLLAAGFLLALQTVLTGNPWPNLGSKPTAFLALSGVVGLAIGDQFLFAGYVLVGARTSTLLMTLAPAVAASLSWIVFGEWMVWQSIVGMVVTLGGVLWVAAERPHSTSTITPKQQFKGIQFGVAAAICQGVGMVLARNGLHGDISPIAAQTVRMSAGAVAIVIVAWGLSRIKLQTLRVATRASQSPTLAQSNEFTNTNIIAVAGHTTMNRSALLALLVGTITGPILGVGFSLYSLQRLEVGVATTLMSLVPVFILPFSKLIEGRWPTARAVVGAVIAVAGVAILASAPHST